MVLAGSVALALLWVATLICATSGRAGSEGGEHRLIRAQWSTALWGFLAVLGSAAYGFYLVFVLYLTLGHASADEARTRVLPHHALLVIVWMGTIFHLGKLDGGATANAARKNARWIGGVATTLVAIFVGETLAIVPDAACSLAIAALVPLPGVIVAWTWWSVASELPGS